MKLTPLANRDEIRAAQSVLRARLRTGATILRRTVTWRGGNEKRWLYWHEKENFWAVFGTSDSGGYWFPYGTTDPKPKHKSVGITCEINPPEDGIDRRRAGVFLRDTGSRIYLGHSGKIGGGRKGIGKNAFLAYYRGPQQDIEWPDGKRTSIIVVSKLSSPTFLSALADFLFAVERFKLNTESAEKVDERLERDAEKADKDGMFDPKAPKEVRLMVERSVNLRRGQPEFRRRLLRAYNGRCAMSNCDCLDALEAAHILPYGGDSTNHVQNGLLLRSDLHTLFDLGKLGIDPRTFRIVVCPKLMDTVYRKLNGKKLRLPTGPARWPNKEVLREHLETWGLI